MKLLIDTNILLDVLLKREPFYHKAVEVLELVQYDHVQEYVSAAAVTDIYYIAIALSNKMDGIVTRNPRDYKKADMKVWSPEQILQRFHTL